MGKNPFFVFPTFMPVFKCLIFTIYKNMKVHHVFLTMFSFSFFSLRSFDSWMITIWVVRRNECWAITLYSVVYLARLCGMKFSASCVTRHGKMSTKRTMSEVGCWWLTASVVLLHLRTSTNIYLSKYFLESF